MMGSKNANFEEFKPLKEKETRHVQWVLMDQDTSDIHGDVCDFEDSSSIDSITSSSSSLEMKEDASSPSSSSSSISSYGPLYELSDLMAQLPIKRGLSKYYQGKSQSYGCLGSVKSLEDLAKKGYSSSYGYKKRSFIKPCKSYAGGLVDAHKYYHTITPKPTITKNKKPSNLISRIRPSFQLS